jgi:hypothetical protein
MAWYVWGALIVGYSALWFWFGILYKGRKIRPIISVMKDSNLSKEDKVKKLIDVAI